MALENTSLGLGSGLATTATKCCRWGHAFRSQQAFQLSTSIAQGMLGKKPAEAVEGEPTPTPGAPPTKEGETPL